MKTAGIICEYNPFHNGHKYQIDSLKPEFDAVVCVMSGSFVQRGDVAVFDKWTRARAALSGGADLVIELPVRFCVSSAQRFAGGGISLLDSLGIIDALSFGSECGDVSKLAECAEIMMHEPPEISEKIKRLTSEGMSFPKARALAFGEIADSGILSAPNNILAIEYITALRKLGSKIVPTTIARKSVGHCDMSSIGEFASAALLRGMLKSGGDISKFTPFDFSDCETYDLDRLTSAFKYKLITCGKDAFSGIADVEPGLENRFLSAVEAAGISEMLDLVKTKRYTRTRLQRIAVSVLLNLTADFSAPEYVRILGMNETGMKLLSQMKTACRLPVVNKVADFDGDSIMPDISATNLAALCADRHVPQNRDFTTSPVIVR